MVGEGEEGAVGAVRANTDPTGRPRREEGAAEAKGRGRRGWGGQRGWGGRRGRGRGGRRARRSDGGVVGEGEDTAWVEGEEGAVRAKGRSRPGAAQAKVRRQAAGQRGRRWARRVRRGTD